MSRFNFPSGDFDAYDRGEREYVECGAEPREETHVRTPEQQADWDWWGMRCDVERGWLDLTL